MKLKYKLLLLCTSICLLAFLKKNDPINEMSHTQRKKVYLAGPDVFRIDFPEYILTLKNLLRKKGFEPLAPLDNPVDLNDPEASLIIYKGCVDAISQSDYVIANITPFRGISVDPGTAYEIGFADALGKTVILYTKDPSVYKTRVQPDGLIVEDFNLVDNLMIVHNNSTYGSKYLAKSFEDAVNHLSTLPK
jgi:nucleoside 2-deoxyribosyltransferase